MSLIHARLIGPATAILLALAGLTASPAAAEDSLTVSMGWPSCTVGQPCSATAEQTVDVQGGVAPYTYAVTAGTFPPGLTLSESGALSGVPTGGGEYTFTLAVTDAVGSTGSATGAFGAYGVYAPNIDLSPAQPVGESGIYVLPSAQDGASYAQTFAASGGTPPYTFSVPDRYTLPDGLTLSPSGVLSGTPTTSGQWDFGVMATDSSTGTGPYTGTYMYELDVAAPTPAPLEITTESVQPDHLGEEFSQQIEVTGGSAPYTFAVTSGVLPDGLTLSEDGVLSGTPTAPLLSFFTITVTDDAGGQTSRQYSTIFYPTMLILTPDALADATVGSTYAQTFAVTNGLAPYTYSVRPADLPPGLSLSIDGVLSGTPTVAGSYSFFVSARDSTTGPNFDAGGQRFTMQVAASSSVERDGDGDGLSDADEARLGTDPRVADTDHDGLDDGAEVHGTWIAQKVHGRHGPTRAIGLVRPNPRQADTDHDGLADGAEVAGARIGQVIVIGRHHRTRFLGTRATDPTQVDTDHDGISDRDEVSGAANRKHRQHRSDPTRWDTDRGGVGDGREIRKGADPADVRSGPHHPHRQSKALRPPR